MSRTLSMRCGSISPTFSTLLEGVHAVFLIVKLLWWLQLSTLYTDHASRCKISAFTTRNSAVTPGGRFGREFDYGLCCLSPRCTGSSHDAMRPIVYHFLLSAWRDPLNFMYRFSACDRNS